MPSNISSAFIAHQQAARVSAIQQSTAGEFAAVWSSFKRLMEPGTIFTLKWVDKIGQGQARYYDGAGSH